MSSMAASSTGENASAGDRALRWIGDLDHPFYSDERNRYVWYEASAIAFQLLFIGSYLVTGLVLLIGGAPALPYALAMFVPTIAAAVVFQGYLKRHSAEYWPGRNDLVRRRGQLGVFAGVFVLVGLVRATFDLQSSTSGDSASDSFFGGLFGGAIVGLFVGPIAAVAVMAYKARQTRQVETDEF